MVCQFQLGLTLLFLLQLFTKQPNTIRIGGWHRIFVAKIKVANGFNWLFSAIPYLDTIKRLV
ncbi:MAG: hypothetical protein A2511_02945 [Deltaproteobacteria bacterium RIFOXYD12_FULL_50_9]|nr:MAG: hypothetical protein A2511_02945 [Deltaproteobacteria bacterium RIFOXYD12_FULL_50_9]